LITLGRLVAGVAHEIGNPLTGILTYAYLLRDSLDENDPRREDVEMIIQETLRCREIIHRLLDFAREVKLKRERFDLNQLIRRSVRLIEKQKDFSHIKFIYELEENLPEIEADPHQIEQVILNLVLNACEAMPDGGRLWIRTRAKEDFVEIEVEDEGVGIPPDKLEVIFEPFYTTKKEKGGTGLGLSICYGIIKSHSGDIKVESTFGKGSKFTVVLPISPSEDEKNLSRFCSI